MLYLVTKYHVTTPATSLTVIKLEAKRFRETTNILFSILPKDYNNKSYIFLSRPFIKGLQRFRALKYIEISHIETSHIRQDATTDYRKSRVLLSPIL